MLVFSRPLKSTHFGACGLPWTAATANYPNNPENKCWCHHDNPATPHNPRNQARMLGFVGCWTAATANHPHNPLSERSRLLWACSGRCCHHDNPATPHNPRNRARMLGFGGCWTAATANHPHNPPQEHSCLLWACPGRRCHHDDPPTPHNPRNQARMLSFGGCWTAAAHNPSNERSHLLWACSGRRHHHHDNPATQQPLITPEIEHECSFSAVVGIRLSAPLLLSTHLSLT